MAESINIQTLLPVGEKLKPLLNKSCISEADMKEILNDRGVFIGENSKKNSIPLLTLSILSPKEFEKLQELQKSKEDSVKLRTSKITSLTQENLNEVLPLSLIQVNDVTSSAENFVINTDLDFTMNSPNSMLLEYEISRQDITKDWASSESKYNGRIEVMKDEVSKNITFRNEFTSSETENVNQKIVKTIVKYLKEKGEVSDKETTFEISADKFSNKQRFAYMLAIANDSPNGFLKFEAVKNIEIGPDKDYKKPLPIGANWMEGSVRNIIINSEKGETLENVEYISNVLYHEVLILREIQSQYKFEIGEMCGTCIIEYGFPHYFRKITKGNFFEGRVSKVYFGKNSKSQNVQNATRMILAEFEKLYQVQYENCVK